MHSIENASSSAPRSSFRIRGVLGIIMLFLLAVLTRNLYAHLATLGTPLHGVVNEAPPHDVQKLEVHRDDEHSGGVSLDGDDNNNILRGDYDPRTTSSGNRLLTDRRWLDDAAALKHSDKSCVCPQIVHCLDEKVEEACLRYMAMQSNVVSLRFDSSIMRRTSPGGSSKSLRNARAPTFLVQFAQPCVRGVARARTELLPYAPESEYIAYDVDRALHFFHVPPTTILWLPVSMIQQSTSNVKEQKWLEKQVIEPARRRRAIIKHAFTPGGPELDVIYVSVQLFIFSTRPAMGTPLQVHDPLFTLLRYDDLYRRAHNYVVEKHRFVVDPNNMYEPDDAKFSSGNHGDEDADGNEAAHKRNQKDSDRKNHRRIRWVDNVSSNIALTSSKISSLLVDFSDQAAKKISFLKKVAQHYRERALHGDYGLVEQQAAEVTAAAGGANDVGGHAAEDVADFGARAQEFTDEANKLADLLLLDQSLPHSFPVLLSYMADRAVFDAVVSSDISPSLHGGEGPQQSKTSRVYLLRTDQVPPSCFGRTLTEDVVEIDSQTGKPSLFQAPNFLRRSEIRKNRHNAKDDDEEDDLLPLSPQAKASVGPGKRYLMPIWIGNQGSFRHRGFLTPAFRGADPSAPGSVCLFRGRTWRVLRRAAEEKTWRSLIKQRVPPQILARPGERQVVDFVEERLKRIVEHQKLCMEVNGAENHVLVW